MGKIPVKNSLDLYESHSRKLTLFQVSPSQPDPPSEVEVIAFDDDSVHLMWKPGFDGGFNQTFDLQVKQDLFQSSFTNTKQHNSLCSKNILVKLVETLS